MRPRSWSSQLRTRSKRKQSGYPIGTIAFYGPTNRHASKVAVGIILREGGDVSELERWLGGELDVRLDKRIGQEVTAFLRGHGVRRVAMAEGIIGCPHEEGVDYPDGEECPECEFWKGKDRFAHAVPEEQQRDDASARTDFES